MIQGDGDYLLEEFHDAGILLPEEREVKRVESERARARIGEYGESNKLAYEMQRAFGMQAQALASQHGSAQRGAFNAAGGAGVAGIAALFGGASAARGGISGFGT